jgi:spore germination cell wall hydrolase CwlJ-like protein
MYKTLEVGALVVAVVLTIPLYHNMNSTQEVVQVETPTEVIVIDPTPKPVSKTVYSPPSREIAIEEMEDFANDCFKRKQCAKLAEAAYFEDRGGGIMGMKAVVNVVMNRVESKRFPNTIAGVVNQKKWVNGHWVCQFSYRCELKTLKMSEPESKIKAGYVAWRAVEGMLRDKTNGADHYLNPDKVPVLPRWARVYDKTATIGKHVFYASN